MERCETCCKKKYLYYLVSTNRKTIFSNNNYGELDMSNDLCLMSNDLDIMQNNAPAYETLEQTMIVIKTLPFLLFVGSR